MAKIHTQTIEIEISRLTRDEEDRVQLLDAAAIEQLEVILGELVADKAHTLIEVRSL